MMKVDSSSCVFSPKSILKSPAANKNTLKERPKECLEELQAQVIKRAEEKKSVLNQQAVSPRENKENTSKYSNDANLMKTHQSA